MLAKCQHRGQFPCMGVQITIRDVPEAVRDELAARAARAGQSMQEFLRLELARLAARPTVDAWKAVHDQALWETRLARYARTLELRASVCTERASDLSERKFASNSGGHIITHGH